MSNEGYIPTQSHLRRLHLGDYELRSIEDEIQIALRVLRYQEQVRLHGCITRWIDKTEDILIGRGQ